MAIGWSIDEYQRSGYRIKQIKHKEQMAKARKETYLSKG